MPAGDYALRTARPDDAPDIATIYAHHVLTGTASFEEQPPTADELRSRIDAVLADGKPYLVAHAAGEIVGYGYASRYRPRPAYRYTVEDSVYIAQAHMGRGIGALLLGALIERCSALGYRQMMAVIGGNEHVASIALHERFGFEQVGRLHAVGYKFGQWHDTVLLQRALVGSG